MQEPIIIKNVYVDIGLGVGSENLGTRASAWKLSSDSSTSAARDALQETLASALSAATATSRSQIMIPGAQKNRPKKCGVLVEKSRRTKLVRTTDRDLRLCFQRVGRRIGFFEGLIERGSFAVLQEAEVGHVPFEAALDAAFVESQKLQVASPGRARRAPWREPCRSPRRR